jgi:hyaluronan synthase
VLVYLLMLRDMTTREFYLYAFALFSTLVWIAWVLKVIISRGYRPWVKPHVVPTAVLIPVVDEPVDLFSDVLRLITAQNPTQVLVVINGARNEALEAVCDQWGVQHHHTFTPGKRNAIREGVELLSDAIGPNDPVLLVDSDTIWTDVHEGTLAELRKPFADASVGGVTTRQRILNPERSFLTRWADWLENSRSLYSFPTQSRLGAVGCLPGRTIAFRRHILETVMPDFMGEKFLGVFLEVSDDRTLTNLCLKQGHRTVYQHTSLVYTDAPLKLWKLYKQQLRWARGSSYNSLRMMPWYITHAPLTGFFFMLDLVLPFLLAITAGGWIIREFTGNGINFYRPFLDVIPGWPGVLILIAAAILASCLSMFIRQYRHWAEVPGDLLRIPAYIIFSTVFLMPIRLVGFFRMAHAAGWGTRKGAYEARPDAAEDHTGGPLAPFFLKDDKTPHQPPLTSYPQPVNPRVNPWALIPHLIGWAVLIGGITYGLHVPLP